MSYFAEPNHIEYDVWFDENIDPIDLLNYTDEKKFSNSVHVIPNKNSFSANSYLRRLKKSKFKDNLNAF